MAGIIPPISAGAQPAGNANVTNSVFPPAPFTVNCTALGLPDDCSGRVTPAQINAIVSEFLAFAECMAPNGTWSCTSLTNLCSAFESYVRGTGAGTLGPDALVALNFRKCDNTPHAIGDLIPSCTEMTAAIAIATSPAVLAAIPAANPALFVQLTDAFGVPTAWGSPL